MVLASGALVHARAYGVASAQLARRGIPAFFERAFDGLWITDVVWTGVLAVFCAVLAVRTEAARVPTAWLAPAFGVTISLTLFATMGSFVAAYLFLFVALGLAGGTAIVARTPGRANEGTLDPTARSD